MKTATMPTTDHGNKCFVMLDYLNFKMYDRKNIMKYETGELKMNTKMLLSACMGLFMVAGCTHYVDCDEFPAAEGCAVETVAVEEEAAVINPICQTQPDAEGCATDPFVNYTRTAADFRAYGERTPRDHMVSQSGAGNNLAAAIPPSIEDEVIEYQEQAGIADVPAPAEEQAVAADVPQPEQPAVVEEVEETVETEDVSDENDENDENADDDLDDEEDPVQDWLAEEGQNLKALLTEWSEKSGWRLVWNTNRNYVLNAGAMFRGRFADVSSALIRAFARARPAPVATFYKGNRVLVVETMEDENAYE